MKRILILFIVCLSVQICLAQKSFKIGFTVEGGYYYPMKPSKYLEDIKNGYSAGAGFWVMKEFHQRLSADVGLTFRQKTYRQSHEAYFNLEHTQVYNESFPYPVIHFKQNLLVIPLHVRIYPTRKFFITGGIEHAFMVNLDEDLNKESEDNWMLGIGSQPGKLSWTFTYSKGFKERGAKRIIGGEKVYTSGYKNRMIQLSLFYPIWQKK